MAPTFFLSSEPMYTMNTFALCLPKIAQVTIPLPHFWWEILGSEWKMKAVSTKFCHISDFQCRAILTTEVTQLHST